MAQAWEYIKIALMNIRSNKGRSILTMLGIIIGITSVIMIISIGDGVKGQVNDELKNRSRANAADMYARGYYDGLEYVSRALVTSKNLVSKKIYQKLLSELS